MRYFTLFLTIISLVFNQKASAITIYTPKASVETTTLQKWIGKGPLFFYDDIIALLDAIENDEIEECSPEDQEEIIQFLILLAREGVLPGEEEALEQDIQELLSQEDCSFSFLSPASSAFPILSTQTEAILCRGWMKKQCKSAKRFIKKHKTGFIIGAVVVVAATAIIFAVASPAVAASAAGASTAAVSKEKNKPKESFLSTTNIDAPLNEVFEEHISSIKEFIVEDTFPIKENPSFTEKARDLGALLAHETLDGISELGSCISQFTQEIKEVGSRILPENIPSDGFSLTPMENYESLVAKGHQKIDQIFSTDHSECYTSETKNRKNDFVIGTCPPPGVLGEVFSDINKLLKAGQALDRAGFTKAGRALMKHGNREGSIFPKPSGNVERMNERGQIILEQILNDPKRELIKIPNGEFKIYSPNGRGVHFKKDGTFKGFVERQYE
ncbi:MAG TPA: hypothetical protein VGZ69_05085 [Candidatus Rhabdochlamydia sp.]|jgi:hypothetical protein|nr:hypothetical protein [Candidatus Rhabdochlamydia sp.]